MCRAHRGTEAQYTLQGSCCVLGIWLPLEKKTKSKKPYKFIHRFVTFVNCLYFPVLSCFLVRWPLLTPRPLFSMFSNFGTFLHDSHFSCNGPLSLSLHPLLLRAHLFLSSPTPSSISRPQLCAPAAAGFVYGYIFKTICVPVCFHYVHPFFFSGWQVSWEEGLGLPFPLGLKLPREQELGGCMLGEQWTRAVVSGRTKGWNTGLSCDFRLGFSSLVYKYVRAQCLRPMGSSDVLSLNGVKHSDWIVMSCSQTLLGMLGGGGGGAGNVTHAFIWVGSGPNPSLCQTDGQCWVTQMTRSTWLWVLARRPLK